MPDPANKDAALQPALPTACATAVEDLFLMKNPRFLFPLLFIFLIFALIRGAIGRGRGWGYGGGWGGPGYYQSPRERIEALHKELHGEKPQDTGTTSPPPSGR